MKKIRMKKNNKGASLILVIGCIALLSVVGSMLILKTASNHEMKKMEEKAQQAFYAAESGSEEMVTALEAIAEATIEEAFSDMLLQYSFSSTDEEREGRYKEYFEQAFKEKLSGVTDADEILSAARGSLPADLTVTFSGSERVVQEAVPTTTPHEKYSDKMIIKDVMFSYTDASGAAVKITTDICVTVRIPDIENGFSTGAVSCDFTDFAVIASDTIGFENVASTQKMKVTGNLYTGRDLSLPNSGHTIEIENAAKILVKGNVSFGKNASNSKLKIFNSSSTSNGYGLWANGITIEGSGASLTSDANLYIADDLNIQNKNVTVVLTGEEYVGYSGNGADATGDRSQANSAITINSAKDIELDMSGLNRLVLSGSSYIHDVSRWNFSNIVGDANLLGVLQGESVAYKDLQSMYLVPGYCLSSDTNPMINDGTGNVAVLESTEIQYLDSNGMQKTLDINDYLSASKVQVRYLNVDGGTTSFIYYYWDFENEYQAAAFFNAYMSTPLGDTIREQAKNLGASTIKLAQNNFLLSNAIEYADETLTVLSPQSSDTAIRAASTATARVTYNSMFTGFRIGAAPAPVGGMESYDPVTSGILDMSKVALLPVGSAKVVSEGGYTFKGYKGDLVISEDQPAGIILVDGNVVIEGTNTKIEGVLIATGTVTVKAAVDFTANQTAVSALLDNAEVAQYFKGFGSAGAGVTNGYLSTEAVTVSFENWTKN